MVRYFNIAKVCDDCQSRKDGLQDTFIGKDECCVFLYESERSLRFWGKNTPQNLYVCAVSDGIVVDSQKIRAFDTSPVVLSRRGDIAIESRLKIQEGSRITILKDRVKVEQ